MSHWIVKLTGIHEKLGLRKLVLFVYEPTRHEAKHVAVHEAKIYGLFNVTIDHMAPHGSSGHVVLALPGSGAKKPHRRRQPKKETAHV